MNIDNDFKGLWKKQEISAIPSANEIFEKASKLKRKTRNKMLLQNILLICTIVFIVFIVSISQPQMITTKIGALLIIIAIISYVIPSFSVIKDIFKNNLESSNANFLDQFIRLKHKQEFLQKTLLTIYFIMLSIGLFLYMIEYAQMMSLTLRIIVYGMSFGWIAFNWFYIRPHTIKKQQSAINEIIDKLKKVNEQMTSLNE